MILRDYQVEIVERVRQAYEKHAAGSRALLFCASVEHAEDVVRRMRVPAELVIGETPREVRRTVRDRVTSGSLRILAALRVLAEDFNPRCSPPWSAPELRRAVRNAARRGTMPVGSLANAPLARRTA